MSKGKGEILIFIAIVALIVGGVVFAADVEARTYNRMTGADVTTFEAIFVRLRIDCN